MVSYMLPYRGLICASKPRESWDPLGTGRREHCPSPAVQGEVMLPSHTLLLLWVWGDGSWAGGSSTLYTQQKHFLFQSTVWFGHPLTPGAGNSAGIQEPEML